ncbi:MAG: bifunctional diguanylate cyclase/phosphohydrolase [Phycisphaerales bacterium]
MSLLRLILTEADSQHRDQLLLMLADGRPTPLICVENDGEHLLRTLRQRSVDAVIVSDSLPDHDVFSLIRGMAPNLLNCPVIVVSHRQDQAAAVRCFRGGVADFIPLHEALTPGTLWRVVTQAVLTYRRRTSERRCSERRQSILRRVADTDAMTGLFNRRYFRQCGEKRLWAGDRRQYLAVNLIDIDQFKQINDTRGHAAGDVMIGAVAKEIRRHCQPADLPFRWGGDEFLVLRYASDLCEAWIWAERLRTAVGRLELTHADSPLKVTLSIGVAMVDSRKFDEKAVEQTDQMLYLAKRCGRDRVCTQEMMRVISAADRVTRDAGLDVEQRRMELLRREGGRLGPAQWNHLTEHSRITGQLAWQLGRILQWHGERALEARRVGLLHDVGKFVMPEVLLGKASPLNVEEWAIMSQTPRWSAIVAEHLGASSVVIDALKELTGDTEPAAKSGGERRAMVGVARVADALAAMLGGRPYRPAVSFAEALNELRGGRGKMFDPEIVEAAHFVSPPNITSPKPAIPPAIAA